MGDFKPRSFTKRANPQIDPRDDSSIALLNGSNENHFVTVKDGIDCRLIAAFRCSPRSSTRAIPSAEGHADTLK